MPAAPISCSAAPSERCGRPVRFEASRFEAGRLRPTRRPLRLISIALLVCGVLAGCVALRRDRAASLAEASGFTARQFDAGAFVLAGWQRGEPGKHRTLTVYIEGDGFAWVNRGRVAENPTPDDPVALRLAAADPAPSVLALARPCQYVEGAAARHCVPFYWSTGRLAPEVVDATADAIDRAMAEAGASRIELIGYSGGGALAVLVAARRHDVVRLVTVAANLDLAAWTRHHGVSPMTGSLDPIDVATRVAPLPQLHYVGSADEVVPPAIVEGFRERAGLAPDRVAQIAGYTHTCCWEEAWPALIARARRETATTGSGAPT
jgi:pimeloyl-ACP methyl ester carboxylesterase